MAAVGEHCSRLQAELLCAQLGGSVRGAGMVTERPRLDPPSQVAPSHLLFSCILTKITALSGTVTGAHNRMYCKTGPKYKSTLCKQQEDLSVA